MTRITIELPHVYGNNAAAYDCHDPEVVLAGPADTGKTVALLTKIHWLAYAYPGASLVILRKQLTDVFSSCLVTFKNFILSDNGGVRTYGGEKPQWFDYPNGSRVWVAGLDKSGKVLSAEHDGIYVNQAEELSLSDWEHLTTRCTGRAGHIKYPQVIGDCNPAHPTHWIVSRAREGKLTKFDSTHRDNPDLYDQETGKRTAEGERRIGALQRLSGERLLRLYHGLWAAPEGAIYDVFDEEKHKVAAFDPPRLWPRVVGVDPFGAYVAAVWLAFDPKNDILNVYREYYEPFGLTTPGHVRSILDASRDESVFAWVGGGPSERQARADFAGAGIPLLAPPLGDVWTGIERVYRLLKEFGLVVHDSCPQLLSELGSYRRKLKDGQPTDSIADKESFHLLDALRYAVVWLTDSERTSIIYAPVR